MRVIWTPVAQQDRANIWAHIAVYEIERDKVWVLTLVHTARQWPPVRD